MTQRAPLGIGAALCVLCFPLAGAEKTAVLLDSLFSPHAHMTLRFHVVVPPAYRDSSARCPVLYLLHGHSGDHSDWVTKTALSNYAGTSPFLVITPEARNSWYVNSATVPAHGFEDYIVKDLIPFVDSKYRTVNSRDGRAIAGLSMGGYGAIHFGLKYPELFFCAASFSGLVKVPYAPGKGYERLLPDINAAFGENENRTWRSNSLFGLADSVSPARVPYFYVSIGFHDAFPGLVEANREFTAMLRKRRIAYEYHEIPGGHSWEFWDHEIAALLRRLSRISRHIPHGQETAP